MTISNELNTTQSARPPAGRPVTIMTAEDNVGNKQYLGNDRGVMDDTRPTFYGMAGANEIVTLYAGTQIIGSTIANSSGEWFVEIEKDLPNGRNGIIAKTDSSLSGPFFVTIQGAPKPVTLEAHTAEGDPLEGGGMVATLPVFSGTAEPFAVVQVAYKTNQGTMYTTVTADESGYWEQTPDFLAIDSIRMTRIEVEATSGDTRAEPLRIIIDPSLAPVKEPEPEPEEPSDPILPVEPSEPVHPNAPSVVSAYDILNNRMVGNGDTIPTSPRFYGTSEPFARVTLVFGAPGTYPRGLRLTTVTADENGNWIADQLLPSSLTLDQIEITAIVGDIASPPFLISIDYDYQYPDQIPEEPEYEFERPIEPPHPADPVEAERPEESVQPSEPVEEEQAEETVLPEAPVETETPEDIPQPGESELPEEVQQPLTPVIITHVLDDVGRPEFLQSGMGSTDDDKPTFFGTAAAGTLVTLYSQGQAIGSGIADVLGQWSVEVTIPLSPGHNEVRTAAHGEVQDTFYINLNIPQTPVNINWVLDNVGVPQVLQNGRGETDDANPTLYGTAAPGQLVTIFSGDIAVGSVMSDARGNWMLEITTALESGTHNLVAKTASVSSDSFMINVQLVEDTPVIISTVLDNVDGTTRLQSGVGSTDDLHPTFYGRAGAGQVVTLYSGDIILGSTLANVRGDWSLEITTALNADLNTVVAKSGSQQSEGFIIRVDSPEPELPSTSLTVGYFDSFTGTALEDGSTTAYMPVLRGTGNPGERITTQIMIGNKTHSMSVQINERGNWELYLPRSLMGQSLILSVTDASGNTTDPFAVSLNPDYVSPELPEVPGIPLTAAYFDSVTGESLSEGGITTGVPELRGTANPGERITAHFKTDQGAAIITVYADGNGNWTMKGPDWLIGKTFTAYVLSRTGEKTEEFTLTYDPTYTEPQLPEVPVVIEQAYDNVGAQWTMRSGERSTDDTNPTFRGTAAAGEIVTLYSGDVVLGSTVVGDNGVWTLEISTPLSVGENRITAQTATQHSDAFIQAVHASEDEPVVLSFASSAEEGRIGDSDATHDALPSFHGKAGVGVIVTLYSGNTVIGSTVSDARGNWSVDITVALNAGMNGIVARVGDQETRPYWVFLNETVEEPEVPAEPEVPSDPDTPVTITSVMDNVGQGQTMVSGVGTTDDQRPTFSGTAAPGAIVVISNGMILGSALADASGNWSVEISQPLVWGFNGVVASVGDNQSESFVIHYISNGGWNIPLNILHAIDDVAGWQQVLNYGETDDQHPTFQGSSTPNILITLYNGETVLGSTVTDFSGQWSLEITTPLTEGRHDIVAKAANSVSRPFVVNIRLPEEVVSVPADDALIPGAPLQTSEQIEQAEPASLLSAQFSNSVTGEQLSNDGWTGDLPLLSGLANPGEKIIVDLTVNGFTSWASVQADDQGNWSMDIVKNLMRDNNNLTFTVRTDSGESLEPFIINIDTALATPAAFTSYASSTYGDLLIAEDAVLFGSDTEQFETGALTLTISEADWSTENVDAGILIEPVKASMTLIDEESYTSL